MAVVPPPARTATPGDDTYQNDFVYTKKLKEMASSRALSRNYHNGKDAYCIDRQGLLFDDDSTSRAIMTR